MYKDVFRVLLLLLFPIILSLLIQLCLCFINKFEHNLNGYERCYRYVDLQGNSNDFCDIGYSCSSGNIFSSSLYCNVGNKRVLVTEYEMISEKEIEEK